MSEQTLDNGTQAAAIPENAPVQSEADRKFYEMNPHLGKSESPKAEEKPSEGVKEDKPKQEAAKPDNGQSEKHGRSGWERRVGSLTKQNKELKTKLEELEKKFTKPAESTEPKKFSRESFKSDEEYLSHIAEQRAQEIVAQKLAEREQQTNESLEEIQQRTRFEKEWQKKTREVFGSDEATKQYFSLVKEAHESGLAEEIPQDVYAFLEESEVGAMLHSILLAKEDIRDRIINLSPMRRALELNKLEERILASKQTNGQEQKQTTSAPDPVGQPSVGGSAKDVNQLPWMEQLRIYQEQRKK